MKPKNLIEIKAKMLCEGVNVSPEIEILFERQNPFKVKRGGLSSGGKMKLAGLIDVNAPLYKERPTDLKLVPDIDNTQHSVTVNVDGPDSGITVNAVARTGATVIGTIKRPT